MSFSAEGEESFQPGRTILFDVNMQIAEGAIVTLVGATGAGKTTVTNLIPWFYDSQEGSVQIGHDVRALDLDFLRGNISHSAARCLSFSWLCAPESPLYSQQCRYASSGQERHATVLNRKRGSHVSR